MSRFANSPALPGALTPSWHADGTPFSPEFGDVYYSRDDGLAESQHVFLEHNALPARFRALRPDSLFTIAETGFGTGLNFLLACELWSECAPRGARLLFRSLEAQPLARAALGRALAQWPRLAPQAAALIEAWPPALAGLHAIEFANGVCLQLFIGDVEQALEEFEAATEAPCVDAWFLDGFAPARNPDMWSPQVLARVGALTRTGGTVATFSAAAAVRSALALAGFDMRKVAGFGRKREMLCGQRLDVPAPPVRPRRPVTPWHRARDRGVGARTVLVVGAGIAGCTTAHALARRGLDVTVLEAEPAVAAGGSGNPQAIVFTQLAAADSAHGEFTVASYLHATRHYAGLLGTQPAAREACGMLQLYAEHEQDQLGKLRTRYSALPELVRAVDRVEAEQLAGVPLTAGGLFFPASGWIDPREACRAALDDPRIHTFCGERIESLQRAGARWIARSASGARFEADAVVLANARAAGILWPELAAVLAPVRGQLTLLPAQALPRAPRCVLCAEGYLIPSPAGTHCCGASFVRGEGAGPPRLGEQQANLAQLADIVAGFDPHALAPASLAARVAERAATPDRLPLVGRVPDPAAFTSIFSGLRANARRVIPERGAYQPGLFVNAGHGSRGMSSAPLAGELVAAELCAEPLPVTQRVARALSPARFIVRGIVRGETG